MDILRVQSDLDSNLPLDTTFQVLLCKKENDREFIEDEIVAIDGRQSSIEDSLDILNGEIDRLTNHSDKYDYIVAVASGVIAGMVDSFYTGAISIENAQVFGNDKVQNIVKSVAQKKGFKGKDLSDAIKFLEDKYEIPADSATNFFGGGTQHHLRDFSHHPTPLGLFFSILTQFTGRVYGTNTVGMFDSCPIDASLIGKDITSKFSIGVVQWFFHLVSDMAGSNGSVAMGKIGTGLPGPFVSLLKTISSIPFFNKGNINKFSLFVSKLFNGTLLAEHDASGKIIKDSVINFDLRTEIGIKHEMFRKEALLPVLLNEVIVRVFYLIRHLAIEIKHNNILTFDDFVQKIQWRNVLPYKKRTIARMLTIATSTFTAIDIADAAIRSAIKNGGNVYNPKLYADFLLRINFVGVGRCVIAISEDSVMGIKKDDKERERIIAMNEYIQLQNAKLFYRTASMWQEADDATESVDEMYRLTAASFALTIQNSANILDEMQTVNTLTNQIPNTTLKSIKDILKN